MSGSAVEHLLVLPQSVTAPTEAPAEIPVSGDTLRAALDDAVDQYPALARFLGKNDAALPVAVVLFADGQQVTDLAAPAPSNPSRLRLVLPSSGG